MKSFEEIQKILSDRLPEIREKFPVKSLGIFGSYVRNEQTKDSDLDILVEFDEENYPSFFKFLDLEEYLTDITGLKIDLVSKDALRKRIDAQILSEVTEVKKMLEQYESTE